MELRMTAGVVTRVLDCYQYLAVGRPWLAVLAPVGRAFTRLLRLQDRVAFYFLGKAHTLANTGEHAKAIEASRASISIWPVFMPAHEILIQLLAHVQLYEKALDACACALEVNGESEAISASVGQILPAISYTDRPEEVIGILKRCWAANRGNVDVFMPLVEMLSKLRRYGEVVQVCQQALKVDPDFFPAGEIIGKIIKNPDAQCDIAGLRIETAQPGSLDEYNWLVASNVADLLVEVMKKFYGGLGVDPCDVPLVQGLDSFRHKLSTRRPEISLSRTQSTLVLFEQAWSQYRSGQIHQAFRAFQTIFYDTAARKKAAHNPSIKEAVVRSGEILGRHQDKLGNEESATAIYRDILSVDQGGVIARRLVVLLSRRGHLREAAELAEKAIISRVNLFPRLRPNPYIASLTAELSRRGD
jgi:tetratricopeptide (TPR) repeat protein